MHTRQSQWERPTHAAAEDLALPDKVKCCHILVKHAGSRNPSSWRTDKITRTKEDARKILEGALLVSFYPI